MGFNKKALSKIKADLNSAKGPSKPRDIIYDPRGQWEHPGQPTRIPGGNITMQGVPYPVMAYPNVGQPQIMYPNQDYDFPGADYVDEYPQMRRGGTKKYSRDITATNILFTKNPYLKKKKKRKNRVYDPSAPYFQTGGPTNIQEEPDVVYNPSMEMSSGGMTRYKKGGKLGPIPLNSGRKVLRDWTYGKTIGMLQEQDGGSIFTTQLSPEEEARFQDFYGTLPENLQQDDPSYDIRGYWDSEGRPGSFNYDQPKEDDGYYHAYSINQNTGEYLKSPWHETFQHAVDEDRRIGWRPITNVQGRNVVVENPSIASPEEQSFLRNTEGPANEFQKGGVKTHKSKDGTVTNTIQNADGSQTIQVKTKDGNYYEKVIPVNTNYENQLNKLKEDYRSQQDYNKLLNYAGVFAYPASVASSYSDLQKGNYGDALAGLIPFIGPGSRGLGNVAKATVEAGTNAGLSYVKALSNANKIKKVIPITTGAAQINDVIKQDGGAIEAELTPEEIEWYISQGYEIEELD